MVNLFKVKKWSAGFLMAFLPTITFLVMIITGDLIQGLIGFFIMTPLAIFIGFKIISHPLMSFLEGRGLMVWTIDSTGTIDTFIVNVVNPFLKGMYQGKKVSTIFNRDAVSYMSAPQKVNGSFNPEPKNPNIQELTLKIPKDRKNSIQFGFQHFPVLIYNKNLGEFISKDAFAKFESDTFVKHLVLYLNRKVEDLTSQLRDFARYIVEQTRPKGFPLGAKWIIMILVLGLLIFLGVMFLPYILGAGSSAADAMSNTGGLITPR